MTAASISSESGWLKHTLRILYWLPADFRHLADYRRARHAFYFPGGIGDDLLCTIPIREFARRGAGRSMVISHHPELFAGNPDVTAVVSPSDPISFQRWIRWGRGPICRPTYHRNVPGDPDCEHPPALPLSAQMCLAAGLTGEVELRPWVHLTPAEIDQAARWKGCIAIQTSVAGARFPYLNKEWSQEKWREVARSLSAHHEIVQIGTAADPALGIGHDLRGRTTLRQLAALLAQVRLFVGLVGLGMHLARAVDRRAVIVYGGREHPDQSGYPCNENLYTPTSCAPCWRKSGCDFERACMERISPADVLAAVKRLLERGSEPLETIRFALPLLPASTASSGAPARI